MRSLVLLVAACLALTAHASGEKKIVCYMGGWAVYRPGLGKFNIEDIQPQLCTHLIYTFVGLVGNDIKVLDAWQDLPDNWGKDAFGRFNALRKLSPSTKTLIAIGGWNEGSQKYSQMASSAKSRSEFVANAVAFTKKHNFDGFDLDWEYPAQRGGSPADVQNFVALVKEMREAFDKEGLLLTAAVGAAKSSASQSYDIPQISKYLHFINLMTYDLHGSWEPQTGINAPLYPAASETGLSRELTVDACVKYWLAQGVDPEKLVLGVASYGRTFTLANPSNNGVGAPTQGPGSAGPYTRESGFYGYNEICDMQSSAEWTVVFDKERRCPYAYNGKQWVGYDNVESIKEKAEYAKKMGLGGAMIWSIETDDFRGKCGESYPLIKTLNHVLRNGVQVSERPTLPPRSTEAPATGASSPVTEGPQPTTPETVNNSGDCKAPGNIPDPNNSSQFFQCVPQADAGYTRITVPCAHGLVFNPSAGICDWKSSSY
ncbi:acidic mammalian chitinase-like isoform X2 [Venturia canescens]|nr:acidic mammalian chitinase-like isoform X2 [Venturia canescens]